MMVERNYVEDKYYTNKADSYFKAMLDVELLNGNRISPIMYQGHTPIVYRSVEARSGKI